MNKDILVLGGLLIDRYFTVDRWPARGQDGFFKDEKWFVGGCAINMASTISNLGGRPYVVSCVGQDQTGVRIRSYLEEHGLPQTLLYPVDGPTGSCLVFSEPDGERTFLTSKGVEECFPDELMSKVCCLTPYFVGVTGYYLLSRDSERILFCLEKLRKTGAKVLFDPSPLVQDIDPGILSKVVELSDILTPNESELSVLGGKETVADLTQAGKVLICKRGARGGTVYTSEETVDYSAAPCIPVDTTGAGDSFSGALLYAMTQGKSWRQSVSLAARCAAKTVQIRGPHGFGRWEEKHDVE